MPSPIRNEWTLTKLLQNTYHHMGNRFEYAERDRVKLIRIESIKVYDGRQPGEARTTFRIVSQSTPQYWPYYTKRDERGRRRAFQRGIKHEYGVIIQLDKLSLNVPFKGRVGADKKWRFESRPRRVNGRVIESENVLLGINGDFFFRCSFLWHQAGILYGHNRADGPPRVVNPKNVVFAPKHMIATIKALMERGYLAND